MNKDVWIDLDGTITDADDSKFKGVGIYGEPQIEAIKTLKFIKENRFNILIFTARGWIERDLIEEYLQKHNIPFHSVICGKPYAILGIDDKVVNNWNDFNNKINKIIKENN